MNPFEQVALALHALRQSLALMVRPVMWLPWLPLAALEFATLALFANAAHPWLSALAAPLVRRLAGDAALHYPALYRALPGLLAPVGLALGAVLGPVATGGATHAFGEAFAGRRPAARRTIAEASKRALAMIVVMLPFQAVALGLSAAIGVALEGGAHGGVVRLLAGALVAAGTVLAQAALFYAAPLVVLERRGPLAALRRLPGTWSRGGVAALTSSLVLFAALQPFAFLGERVDLIVGRGRPELVAWLLAAEIGGTLLAGALLAGSATLAYLAAVAREDR